MNKETKFLKEYEKLCQKYKLGLYGCGCCGSPFLNDIEYINYDEVKNKILIGELTIKEWEKLNEQRKNQNTFI